MVPRRLPGLAMPGDQVPQDPLMVSEEAVKGSPTTYVRLRALVTMLRTPPAVACGTVAPSVRVGEPNGRMKQ